VASPRAGTGRLAGLAVLAGGLAVLALGTLYALRQDGTPARAAGGGTHSVSASAALPRLDVSYVQLPLEAYERARTASPDASLAFAVVPTEIEERIRTDRPPLHPDFGKLFYVREYDGVQSAERGFVQAFRERRVANEESSVAGLLVSQPAAGPPVRLRLEVERTALRGFREMYDLTDTLETAVEDSTAARLDVTSSEQAQIEWVSDPAGSQQFVPLLLLQGFSIPDIPANQAVIKMGEGALRWQLATDAFLGPRRLFVRVGEGPEREIDIGQTLSSPLEFEFIGRRSPLPSSTHE
jgi:hypothetical protein